MIKCFLPFETQLMLELCPMSGNVPMTRHDLTTNKNLEVFSVGSQDLANRNQDDTKPISSWCTYQLHNTNSALISKITQFHIRS